ncbi:hypothetical protein EI94DRAFT_1820012 [Lactarius quietus]|nr:hypothetical protein EI94DRAFT_1820012 [Lactarius quietus]
MIWSTKPILNSIVEQSNRLPKGADDFGGPPNSDVLLGQLLPKGEELEVDEDEDVPNENVDFDSREVAGEEQAADAAGLRAKPVPGAGAAELAVLTEQWTLRG